MRKMTCFYQIQVGDTIRCSNGDSPHYEESLTRSTCEACDQRCPYAPIKQPPEEVKLVNPVPETFLGKVAHAAKVVADSVVSGGGNPFEVHETVKQRRETCGGCEFRKNLSCTLCSCNIHAKAVFKSAKCPKGKWPGELENQD